MSFKPEDIKFKRDFLLLNFNNTIELRTKRYEYLTNLKYWFVILWNSAFGFSITKGFELNQIQLLLLSIVITFFTLHIIILTGYIYLQETIELFEKYLIKSNEKDILSLHGPLITIVKPNMRRKYKISYFLISLFKIWENIFYYILFIFSIVIPLVFSL